MIGQFFSERSECGLKKCSSRRPERSAVTCSKWRTNRSHSEGQKDKNVTVPKAGHVKRISAAGRSLRAARRSFEVTAQRAWWCLRLGTR